MSKNNKPGQPISKTGLKWTYQGTTQAEMLALAQLGQSNNVIKRDCKMTDNEINYGLTKAQKVMGIKGGFRRGWADGRTPIVQKIKRDILAVLRQDIQRSLPQQIIHPTPETVNVES